VANNAAAAAAAAAAHKLSIYVQVKTLRANFSCLNPAAAAEGDNVPGTIRDIGGGMTATAAAAAATAAAAAI
jgi:hypothetical protein